MTTKKQTILPQHDMLSQNSKAQSILNKANQMFEKLDAAEKDSKVESQEAKEKDTVSLRPLKELLFLGSIKKEIELNGFKFVLKTPSNSENREAAKKIFLLPESERFIDGNTYQLSNSLESINGFNVFEIYEQLYGEESAFGRLDTGFKILSDLDAGIVGKLLDVYLDLSNENKKIVSSGDLQKDIKK
jgi:hypothetical protein